MGKLLWLERGELYALDRKRIKIIEWRTARKRTWGEEKITHGEFKLSVSF